ncbi:hypothetical protein ScPMuIL_018900 [Solemya velum]
MYSFHGHGGMAGQMPTLPGENTEELRQKRYAGLRGLYRLSVVIIFTSFGACVAGVCTLAFAAPNLNWPFAWGGALFPGILMLTSGILGFTASRNGLKETAVSGKVKCMVIGQYALSVTSISFSFLSIGYAVWCITICQQDTNEDNSCLPNQRANTALAVVNIVLGLVLGVLCILGTCFFCCYGRALGFKSRREQFMQMQMQLMQAQMAAQQAQTRGQHDAPPPYPGPPLAPAGQPTEYSYNTNYSSKY